MTDDKASAHGSFSAPASRRAAQTRSVMYRLARSAFPFCCEEYGAVFSDLMPLSSYQA